MNEIEEVILKLKKAKETLTSTSFQKEIIENNSKAIEDLNRDQLKKGINSDGGIFPDYKSKKKEGPIKWFDKGDYYKSLKTGFFSSGFLVESTDEKDKYIEDRKGPVKGLTEMSLDLLRKIVKVQIFKKIKTIVHV
jgi:hypothetical protein